MPLPAPSPDSVALVTGASAGIGREFARALAERGHGLALVARRADRLEELAAELRDAHGVRVEVVPTDLADRDARNALIAELATRGVQVDVLVNNAGFGIYRSFAASEADRELQQLAVLVEAVVHLNAEYLPGMVEHGRGAIVNVSSTSAFQALPGSGTYAAAKSYVLLHSEALSAEVKGKGVTVTAVCPGPVSTEFQEVSEPLFIESLPKFVWVTPERVVADSLRAVQRGKRVVVPGGPGVRAFFSSSRVTPSAVTLAVTSRMMAADVEREDELPK